MSLVVSKPILASSLFLLFPPPPDCLGCLGSSPPTANTIIIITTTILLLVTATPFSTSAVTVITNITTTTNSSNSTPYFYYSVPEKKRRMWKSVVQLEQSLVASSCESLFVSSEFHLLRACFQTSPARAHSPHQKRLISNQTLIVPIGTAFALLFFSSFSLYFLLFFLETNFPWKVICIF